MHSNNEKLKKAFMGIFALIIGIMACNLPGQSNAGNSSFDNAHLMMFANRINLGFYDQDENSTLQNKTASVLQVSYQNKSIQQNSQKNLNEHKLLAEQYQGLAEKALFTENEKLYWVFKDKAKQQDAMIKTLERERERAEWRRRRRFSSIIKRAGHGIGRALDFTMHNVAHGTDMVITSYVDNYVGQVKSFIRNPLRYGFQHYVSIQLGILKDQFIDKAGPFFGNRAYEVIKVEEFAEKVEVEIFGEEHPQQPTAAITPTDDVENAKAPVGTYEGKTNLPEIFADSEVSSVFRENHVVVNIAEDGTVSGNFKVIQFYPPHSDCIETWDIAYDGTFSGELKDTTGQIPLVLAYNASVEVGIVNDFCGDHEVEESYNYMVDITVKEGIMIGVIQGEGGISFTATKNEQ